MNSLSMTKPFILQGLVTKEQTTYHSLKLALQQPQIFIVLTKRI
jgi:hypothetical protein